MNVPVGVPVPGLTTATVAVKVTGSPKTDVLFGDEGVSVVVVAFSAAALGVRLRILPRVGPPAFDCHRRSCSYRS